MGGTGRWGGTDAAVHTLCSVDEQLIKVEVYMLLLLLKSSELNCIPYPPKLSFEHMSRVHVLFNNVLVIFSERNFEPN